MENENNTDYKKIVENELNENNAIEPQLTPEPVKNQSEITEEKPKKSKKLLFIILIIIFLVVAGSVVTALVLLSDNSQNKTPETSEGQTEYTEAKAYSFEMPELGVKIQLPEEFNKTIFSENDGENYYIWGYTSSEKPDYITIDKNSPDFFPLFALNYSDEEFQNGKYSFYAGDGAYGREDGSVLYLHEINLEKLESAEATAHKLESGEELSQEENELLEKFEKVSEEIDTLELYFKDGFKYQDL